MTEKSRKVNIVGGGLAGSEATYFLAKMGFDVTLYEMRDGDRSTDAHRTDKFAELVCSNSFRNDDVSSAIGLLHEEMRRLGSLVMEAASETKVPAGGALAVDREAFSKFITERLQAIPNIKIIRREITELPKDNGEIWLFTTGPLTSPSLFKSLEQEIGDEHLSFYDAIAPIIFKDSIDFSKAWFQSRYDKGGSSDYINCPMDQQQYEEFISDLSAADRVEFHDWEKPKYFDGCLPLEVMAERGGATLRFGPLKPVGLTNPHNPTVKPYAVVQLRQDNRLGTLYNMVGFQTKMTYGEQARVFRKIPGLERAEFARFGGIHRNTFLNSPRLLTPQMSLRSRPNLMFAGQITGVEGYVESAAMGLLAGIFIADRLEGREPMPPPLTTAIGALLSHITAGHLDDGHRRSFQPMNINFGIFTPLEGQISFYGSENEFSASGDNKIRWKRQDLDNLSELDSPANDFGQEQIPMEGVANYIDRKQIQAPCDKKFIVGDVSPVDIEGMAGSGGSQKSDDREPLIRHTAISGDGHGLGRDFSQRSFVRDGAEFQVNHLTSAIINGNVSTELHRLSSPNGRSGDDASGASTRPDLEDASSSFYCGTATYYQESSGLSEPSGLGRDNSHDGPNHRVDYPSSDGGPSRELRGSATEEAGHEISHRSTPQKKKRPKKMSKRERGLLYSHRALADLAVWMGDFENK